MKFTSEDLMKAMGLAVGDKIKVNNRNIFKVISETTIQSIETEVCTDIIYIIDQDFEILPNPKRVGDLKCKEQECRTCPIRFICQENRHINNTLYFNLELYKKDQSIHYDQEIYNLLKARLDKEVVEE